MAEHFDDLEVRSQDAREAAFFAALPAALDAAKAACPGWADWLADVTPGDVTDGSALAQLPVLAKTRLMEAQAEAPPFGGFVAENAALARVFVSPGPVYVAEPEGEDVWGAARALFAAGVRAGDLALNTFGYHMTPGAFILESGLRALKCPVLPAGPGNTDALLAAISAFSPTVYCGVPDFLNIVLQKGAEAGLSLPLTKALVSGAALPPSLRETIEARGASVAEAYATADLGVIAYQSEAREGLIVNEGLFVEIVRPGSGDPLPVGEVGEVVVTRLHPAAPLVRFATGDLSKILPGASPCGRTAPRLAGWMGRADQRTKVKGLFVDPKQIAGLMAKNPEIAKARLVVSRSGEQDAMTLKVEGPPDEAAAALSAALKEATGLSGTVEVVAPGTLPNDGKIIADERAH